MCLANEEVTVASKRDEQDGISRREFASRVGAAAASIAIGGQFFDSAVHATSSSAHVSGRVIGANDRVVTASIGIRGQGNSLKRGFAKLKNVEIKTLCDIDANLAPERINDARLKDVETFRPGFAQDLRRVLDDKDIDAVVIATPNHWHALATIWALQAGKHVYVEKPSSHTVWEGRKMVEATARYNKIVQVGTMNRSRPADRDAIKFIQEGGLGKGYRARISSTSRAGVCRSRSTRSRSGRRAATSAPSHRRRRPTRRRASSSTPTARCSSSARAADSRATKGA